MQILKTLTIMANEYKCTPKTLKTHIKKDEELNKEIKSGLLPSKAQKKIYEKFGYPPSVNKSDYENV
jgi:hypothetical protein